MSGEKGSLKEQAEAETEAEAEVHGRKEDVAVDVRLKKKRWNSVVYPVIYNWKLGTTTRPKAIRRFHSGESPFLVLPKVVRPSSRIDASCTFSVFCFIPPLLLLLFFP